METVRNRKQTNLSLPWRKGEKKTTQQSSVDQITTGERHIQKFHLESRLHRETENDPSLTLHNQNPTANGFRTYANFFMTMM